MSSEKLRFMYRCVLVVELLLAFLFILLSNIAIHQRGITCDGHEDEQQESSLYKVTYHLVLPYAILTKFLALIAIWATPKQGSAFMLTLFPSLMLPSACSTIADAVIAFIRSDIDCPSFSIFDLPSMSYICLTLAIMALWVDLRTDDDVWQSPGRYTPVSVNDPIGTHN
jgi:hypothetical protein